MFDAAALTSRRTIVKGGALLSAATALPCTALAQTRRRFPAGFRWGASTAAHQIEGNNANSDLWLLENLPQTVYKERSGDACDSYHRWREDIALVKALGLNSYRMSIEWARIEPSPGHFSTAEIDHYRQIIAAVRAAGIDPVVTFFHFSAPRWFAERGGWLNKDAPQVFARYCDKAARLLGDGIAFACTINEPQVALTFRVMPVTASYYKALDQKSRAMHAAAAKATNADRFVSYDHPDIAAMTPQLIAGHEQAFAAIKAVLPKVPTGVTLSMIDYAAANEGSDLDAVCRAAYDEWMASARRAGDFVGVQAYSQFRIPGPGAKLPPPPPLPSPDRGDPADSFKQPVALKNAVEYAYRQTRKPIFVTENGFQTENDTRRAWYIPKVLEGLHEAIQGGVPVIGYLHWSLLDNFEWASGYGPKYGLVSVDRQTFKRTMKPSAAVYRRIVRANAV